MFHNDLHNISMSYFQKENNDFMNFWFSGKVFVSLENIPFHFNGVSDILVPKFKFSSLYFTHDSVQLNKYKVFKIALKESVLVRFNRILGTA